MSQAGAKLIFPDTAVIPSEFDRLIRQRGDSRRARVKWRVEKEAGVQFQDHRGATGLSIEASRRIGELKQDRVILTWPHGSLTRFERAAVVMMVCGHTTS